MKMLLSLFLAVAMLLSMTACQAAEPECDHDYKIDKVVDSTCKKAGYTKYECSDCGHSYKLESEKLEHTYVNGTCTLCGDEIEIGALYIPVIAKGEQHQFWQAVREGAKRAATDYHAELYFAGPASEVDIDIQIQILQAQLEKNPSALALAALSTEAVKEILQECAEKGIPVIGFDSGVPGDTSGAVKATVSTNNENAAAIVADKFGEHPDLVDAMKAATVANPVRIAVLSQDPVSASIAGRTTGFVNKMYKIASQYGTVAIDGHDRWRMGDVSSASIIIEVAISATTEFTAIQHAANTLLAKDDLIAVFCSNEGTVTGFLAAVSDGYDLADGGKYEDLVVAGFDAGRAQKTAVRNGWFYGSVTQDPYMIGYLAVELAVKAARGEDIADVDSGAKWYDASNIDDPSIALLVYD